MIFDSAYERGDYDYLYANYLGDGHGSLGRSVKRHCEEHPTEMAVDLCAGTGHMAFHLFDCGVDTVVAVDKHQAVLDRILRKFPPIYRATRNLLALSYDLDEPGSFKKILDFSARDFGFDLVTCRQGIGYLDPATLSLIPDRLLDRGGVFLFNSFVEPPKGQPWFHNRGDGIYEAGVYYDGRVYHAQFRWPRLDLTMFEWHDIVGVHGPAWERKGYEVDVARHNRTLIVKVIKP